MKVDLQTFSQLHHPAYVLEEQRLRKNLELISNVACRSNTTIILAFKAFALWKTFSIFREFIPATTASSLYEARLGYEKFGSRVHTFCPGYTEDNISEIAHYSSHLIFNSLSQYQGFAAKARIANSEVSLGLRVNPEYSEVETLLYNPCAPGSRFGVTADQLPEELPEDIDGFHCHCHCESGADVFQRTLAHFEEKFGKWLPQLKWINFGGGHLMTRKDYDTELLINILNGFHKRYPHLKLILEPGSAFLWQTGPLVSQQQFSTSASHVTCPIVWRCLISHKCVLPKTLAPMPKVSTQQRMRHTSIDSEAIPALVATSWAIGSLTMNYR